MEKKNTVLLTVIAVATLLVAVVGATFAYFTASTSGTGAGSVNTQTSTTIGSVALNLANTAAPSAGDLKYPGGMMMVGAKVDATVTGQGTFGATYTINASVDASAFGTDTTVKYTLYRGTSEVAASVGTCELKTSAANGETQYWYEGCAAPEGLGTEIATGTVTGGDAAKAISVADESFAGLTSSASKTNYYYLVVEYQNNTGKSQNADQGESITAQITEITAAQSTAAAA